MIKKPKKIRGGGNKKYLRINRIINQRILQVVNKAVLNKMIKFNKEIFKQNNRK